MSDTPLPGDTLILHAPPRAPERCKFISEDKHGNWCCESLGHKGSYYGYPPEYWEREDG